MIRKFIIIPRFGNTASGFDFGSIRENVTQLDVVNNYTQAFVRHLQMSGIIHELIPNDKNPGIDEKDRLPLVPAGTMAIICGCGVSKFKKTKRNFSSAVAFGHKNKKYAHYFLEGMNDWGKSLNYDHGSQKPLYETDNPFVRSFPEQIPILEIRPFQIGAPGVDDYWPRMDDLGRILANCVREIILDMTPTRR